MKTWMALLAGASVVACAAPPQGADASAPCTTLMAGTGTNRLSRQACGPRDDPGDAAAQAQVDALQRDQVQRSLPRPQKGGS
jgi:hypothetical protein